MRIVSTAGLAVLLLSVGAAASAHAQVVRRDGFVAVRVDTDKNKIFLELTPDRLGKDLLHEQVLATGAGSSELGLDRGQAGGGSIVRFERHGKRVLVVEDNWNTRAPAANAAGQRAAAEAMPYSITASLPIESEEGGTLVVDATSLFLSDTYGIAGSFRRSQQGTARVDAARSWIDTSRTKAFPTNTEIHAVLAFDIDNPGFGLRRTVPNPESAVFEVHHSLVQLPDTAGFRARKADSRSGLFGSSYSDFSQSLEGTYRDAFADRWRLVPKDPAAYLRGELVEPVKPIIYYLDPGMPEPYRTAFKTGGNWWAKVFEAAGFRNAFSVRDLPAGVDPMDARYSMLYWVHRTAPGPSVGASFSDPRTGEIVRGQARMDSWRSLIDYNIYAGMLPAAGPNGFDMSAEEFAMGRRRQHAAHEIGHTLGLSHNFIAESQGRNSVMDYPVALITVDGRGNLDLSQAYRNGPGGWDTLAIKFGYTWFPDARSEAAGLERIVREGLAKGTRFVADQHSGAEGSIPEATRWVEGSTMFDAVERTSAVRRVLIDKFDERAIKPGEPMYLLNMRFTHVYLHHRYSLEGLVKYVGGMDFRYAMRGDGQIPTQILPAASQRRALTMALDALEPAELAVPERVMALIPPVPAGGDGSLAWMGSAGGTAFDQVSLAGGLAREVVEGLLNPERAARLVLFGARAKANPTLDEVMRTIVDRSWGATPSADANLQALRRAEQRVVANALLDLAGNARAMSDVRSMAELHLTALDTRLAGETAGSSADRALRAATRRDIAAYFAGQDDPAKRSRFEIIALPWP